MAIEFGPESDEGLEALQDFIGSFDARSQQRGRSYFSAGRVSKPTLVGNKIVAHVRGSQIYGVDLNLTARGWSSQCSCPLGFNCKHAYATGLAWLLEHASPDLPIFTGLKPEGTVKQESIPHPKAESLHLLPGEQPLIHEFQVATGRPPERVELAFLRNLARVHQSVRQNYGWFDHRALADLAPAKHRHQLRIGGYGSPFQDWFTTAPTTPLKLWSFVALLFTENDIPLPSFTEPFTDLQSAVAEREHCRQEIQLRHWRARFAQLDALTSASEAPAARQSLRLRLTPRNTVWEIAGQTGTYVKLQANQLRDFVHQPAECARALDDVSNVLVALVREHFSGYSRSSLNYADSHDCELLGTFLADPRLRPLIVSPDGAPIADDPRPVTWRINDHPSDPALVLVDLVLPDGSPLPEPVLLLPGTPTRYLHAQRLLFHGLPPIANPAKPQHASFSVEVPRKALELPEAGRFAARAGVRLPGSVADRFRSEKLHARLRARISARRDNADDEILVLELHALSPANEPRARYQPEGWRHDVPGLVTPDDHAWLLHDHASLAPAEIHLKQLPGIHWDGWAPEGGRYTSEITGKNFPEQFAAWLAAVPPGLLVELSPELASFAKAPDRASVVIEIDESSEIDWFDVHTSLRVEDTSLTEKEIDLLMKARGRWVRLAKHGWRRLAVDDQTDAATRAELDRLGLAPETDLHLGKKHSHRYHTLQLAGSLAAERDEALAEKLRARAASLRAIVPPALPNRLQAELRPYQEEGYQFLAHLAALGLGGVLADDMGLGKTLQTLTWFLWLQDRATAEKRPFRALVVCPKSVVPNWQLETKRFTPALSAAPLDPLTQLLPATGIVVVNYAQLRLRADTLLPVQWEAVVLDEGQNIKNPSSSTAQTARALKARHRLVLTGTPIENRLLDLWSLLAFAQPGLLGSQAGFQRLYREKDDPAGARSRLATRVRPFLLRRTKSQVANDLPPRVEEDLFCELDGRQRTLYDAELKRARQMLLQVKTARQFDIQRFNILQSLLRLRQICCDPRLVGLEGEPPVARKKSRKSAASASPGEPAPAASAKMEALLDTIEPLVEEGHRVLIFSQFVTMLELIRDELTARSIGHLMLTGQTENRQELVDKFQSVDGPPIFLLSLKAAGSGLNLTAASYVVLYDPWWNPAVEAQAIDRTHRIGQTSKVNAYRLIAKNTIEEKIRALQREKAAMAAAVVKEESLATVLDLESLRKILS
ncbi:MAG: DEAD/DEAH box helicase [Nibricoccus sp.]